MDRISSSKSYLESVVAKMVVQRIKTRDDRKVFNNTYRRLLRVVTRRRRHCCHSSDAGMAIAGT